MARGEVIPMSEHLLAEEPKSADETYLVMRRDGEMWSLAATVMGTATTREEGDQAAKALRTKQPALCFGVFKLVSYAKVVDDPIQVVEVP